VISYKVVVDVFEVDDSSPTKPLLLESQITCLATFLIGPLLETLIFVLPASNFLRHPRPGSMMVTYLPELLRDWNEGEQVQQPQPPPGDPVSINPVIFSFIKIPADLISITESRHDLELVVSQGRFTSIARQVLRCQ
jgi:hypothetical protein